MDKGWQRAKEIYEQAKPRLEGHLGEIMAIDIETGEYFLGKTTSEACEQAEKRSPQKTFYLMRVGARATYFFGTLALDENFPGNPKITILKGMPKRELW